MRLPISFVPFNRQENGLVAVHKGGNQRYVCPWPWSSLLGAWGGGRHGLGSGPHHFCGILGAGECLPRAIAFILSSSSAGKSSSLVMGLFQGDSHGNREWEAALSTCVMRVTAAAHPRLEGVRSSARTFSAPRGSQAGSLGCRGASATCMPSASACEPAHPALPTRAPKALSYETQAGSQGHPGLALARSSLLASGSWMAAGTASQVLLVGPLRFEPVNRSWPK